MDMSSGTVSRERRSSPFVHGEQGKLWKLPAFDDASLIFSAAPFELVAAVIRHAGFSDVAGGGSGEVAALATRTGPVRDRRYLVSFCLWFVELAIAEDAPDSCIRRSFLP